MGRNHGDEADVVLDHENILELKYEPSSPAPGEVDDEGEDSSLEVVDDGGEPCMICVSPGGRTLTRCFSRRLRFLDDERQGGGGVLEPHVTSIFVVRHLLRLTKRKCENLLKSTVLHPGHWFSLCDACAAVVQEGLEVHLEMVQLKRKVEEISKLVRESMEKSLEVEKKNRKKDEGLGGIKSVYQLIREEFSSGDRGDEGGGVENSDDDPNDYMRDHRFRHGSPKRRKRTKKKKKTEQLLDVASAKSGKRKRRLAKRTPTPDPTEQQIDLSKASGNACPFCDARFAWESGLRVHIGMMHQPKEVEGGDGKKLTSVARDPRKYRFPCPHCPKRWTTRSNMRIHVASVHEKRRPFQCNICGQTFTKKPSHQLHLAKHAAAAENPHVCTLCNAKFPSDSELRIHIHGTHDTTKQLNCRFCTEVFDALEGLHNHLRTSHREKCPNACDECFIIYKNACDLKRHLEKKHGVVSKGVVEGDRKKRGGNKKGRKRRRTSSSTGSEDDDDQNEVFAPHAWLGHYIDDSASRRGGNEEAEVDWFS